MYIHVGDFKKSIFRRAIKNKLSENDNRKIVAIPIDAPFRDISNGDLGSLLALSIW